MPGPTMSTHRENVEQSWKQDPDSWSPADFTAQPPLLYLLMSVFAIHCFENARTWAWLFWTHSSSLFSLCVTTVSWIPSFLSPGVLLFPAETVVQETSVTALASCKKQQPWNPN